MKKNYQIEMEQEIGRIRANGTRPILVLHACCAPCSSAVLERLTEDFRLIVYDYNPNIAPESEFRHRLDELRRLAAAMPLSNDVEVVEAPYDPERFYALTRGHEDDPEGGDRCGICFEMRLRKTAEYAVSVGADYFTTTLSISPLKNAERLNTIGEQIAEEYGVRYLNSDFKKKNGYRRSCELSAMYDLYRQDYCGCVFSKEARRNLLSETGIARGLRTKAMGRNLELHEAIASTNDRARELARAGAAHGTVVVADHQSAGRGRFARQFWSPEGTGVYLSVVLRPDMPAADAVRVTPMAAVAVARACETQADIEAKIKWVNDIYVHDRKVCGILCEAEMDPRTGQLCYIVAGIGVNLTKMEFPEDLKEKATSLENECGKHISRNRFTSELLNQLEILFDDLSGSRVMEEYRDRSNVIGREITVLRGDEVYSARAVDIDMEGSLIVEKEDGTRDTLRSGEISIRF